jgi:BirA family biotin operon repressor/biotin-[acetyl-CoA-carboxylase] ligase
MERRVIGHAVIPSTNEAALDAIAAGSARDGDVHVALGQSAGRGRLGRRWESPPGEGLYATLVHLPPAPGPPAPALTMAVGLGVLDLLRGLGLARAALDWPNDLVVGPAKVAGILVETRSSGQSAPRFAVGVGLNVRQRAFAAELLAERAVTSLALEGIEADPAALLEPLLDALEPRLVAAAYAPEALAADYLAATGLAGAAVRVRAGREELEGRVLSLGVEAGLSLLLAGGGRRAIPLAHLRSLEPRT